MALGDGKRFPLVDRSTPLVDRVRGAANSKFLGKSMAKTLAAGMIENSDEERQENAEEVGEWFSKQLAEELGLPEDAISDDAEKMVTEFFTETSETDLLTDEALEELGVSTDSDEDDDEDEEDGPSFD